MPFPSSLPHTANNLPGEIDLNGKIYASVVDPSPWSEPLYILSHSALLDIMYNHKIPPALEKSFPDFNPSPSFHAATSNTLGRHQLPPASRSTAFDDTTMPFASGAAQQVATLFHDPSVAFPFVVPDNDYFPLTTDQLTAGKGPDQRHAHDPSLVPTFPPGESLETTPKSPLTAFPSCETENRRSLSALNQNGRTKLREAQSSRHRGGACECCYQARKRCGEQRPCSRCKRMQLECVPRERRPRAPRQGGLPAAGISANMLGRILNVGPDTGHEPQGAPYSLGMSSDLVPADHVAILHEPQGPPAPFVSLLHTDHQAYFDYAAEFAEAYSGSTEQYSGSSN